jgi:hypothetical protein
MDCYVVFNGAKQVRVFHHDITGDDWKRAKGLAIDFASKMRAAGYDFTVEHFDLSGVGTTVRF